MVQILIEIDELTAFFMLDKLGRDSHLFLLIKDILTVALEPSNLEKTTPMTSVITTHFRRRNKRTRKDVFAKFVYENNNKDGKTPVNLTQMVEYMNGLHPTSAKYSVAEIFKGILEELHNEILVWNREYAIRQARLRKLEREAAARERELAKLKPLLFVNTVELEGETFGKGGDTVN